MGKRILAALLTAVFLLSGCSAGRTAGSSDSGTTSAAASGKSDSPDASAVSGKLKIYFFSAGKADAILLYGADFAVLIDTGLKGFGGEIVSYLKEQGIDTLDALILTHFDEDHVGGAAKVLKKVAVKQVYQSDCPKDSKEYANYVDALGAAGLTPVTVRKSTVLTLGNLTLTVDPPRETSYAVDPSNNSSLILSAQYGEKRFLFAGDAEDARLAEFLSENSGTYDLLKVPYHGHWQDGLADFLSAVSPRYAVITSSDKQPEDAETVSALKSAGAKVFLTRQSPVLAVCDGSSLTVSQ
jgi:competence protein ComEC